MTQMVPSAFELAADLLYPPQTERMSLRQWADMVPEQRGPLDFARFAFQRELYGDRATHDREQVVVKATQCGISSQAIRWMLYHADMYQRTGLYVFPTATELNDFSRHRIGPLLRNSDHLRRRVSHETIDTVGQKQIGLSGWAYFRGASKPIDSIAADVMVIDEFDSCDPLVLEASERRISGPESAGLIRRVGVPSIPGYGISGQYDISDQRAWTVKCEVCGHQNRMVGYETFEANVDRDTMRIVCAECRRPLDMRAGEWVAAFPDRPVRGYHVPKLIVPGVSLSTLVANSQKTRPDQVEAFHTRDLGEPYAPAEGRLSIEAVQACVRPDVRLEAGLVSYGLTTMGVDMASARALNVVIEDEIGRDTNTGRKVFVGTVEDTSDRSAFQELCRLMDAYNVNLCGIDNEPDGRWSAAFARRFPGRVYRMDFFTPQAGGRTEPPSWNVKDEEQFCSLWRTKIYDAMFERFRLQRVLLPPLDMLPEDYPQHLGNLYRRRVELPGQTGRTRVEYVRTGPEDYAQCEAYNLAAIELYWRNAGLTAVAGQGPRPLVDEIDDFEPLDLSSYVATFERP